MTNRLAELPTASGAPGEGSPSVASWRAWLALFLVAGVAYAGAKGVLWAFMSQGKHYSWQEYGGACVIGAGTTVTVLLAFFPGVGTVLAGSFAAVRGFFIAAGFFARVVWSVILGTWLSVVAGVGILFLQAGIRGLIFGPTLERIFGVPFLFLALLFAVGAKRTIPRIRAVWAKPPPEEVPVTLWGHN